MPPGWTVSWTPCTETSTQSIMSYILDWHVPNTQLESAVDLLSEVAPWGWEETTGPDESVLRIHVQERRQLKHLQDRIRRRRPEARLEKDKEKDADWQTAWQFFFQPVQVADTFCILPPWKLEDQDNPDLVPLIVHPKMAFGTGHHPTTILCLQAMVQLRDRGLWPAGGTVLDLGTGSGILAIASVFLGSGCIALDIDPVATDNARENIEANGVSRQVLLGCADISALGPKQKFPLVVANILAGPLIRMAPELASLVQERGTLILSGVLGSQVESVTDAYRLQGMGIPRVEHLGEWASLVWSGTEES